MSEINFSELSYVEIQHLIIELKGKKNKIEKSIIDLENTADEQKINRNYDICKEIENEDIPEEKAKLSKVESQLFEVLKYVNDIDSKTEMIKKDEEPELSVSEAQYIIDEYSPLVDYYLNEKKYDQERITELGNPKDEDGYDQLREARHDLKDDEEQFQKCTKILNYAQCYSPKTK